MKTRGVEVWVLTGVLAYFVFGLVVGEFTDAGWIGLAAVAFGIIAGYGARNVWLWRRSAE